MPGVEPPLLFRTTIGVNALQTLGVFPFPSVSSLFRPFYFPSLHPLPVTYLGGLGSASPAVRAEPGHETHFGAFRGKNEAFQGTDFWYF